MAVSRYRTVMEFRLRDLVTAGLNRMSRTMGTTTGATNKMAGSFVNLAGAFTAVMVAGKVRDVLSSILEPTMKMEFAMKRLEAISGATAVTMSKMGDKAREAAEKTIFGPVEAAEAMTALQRATADTDATMKLLNQTLGIAQASFGKLTPEVAARQIGQMVRAFGLTGKRAGEAAFAVDKVFAASRKAGIEIQEVTKVMGRLGAAAERGNQSLEGVTTAFLLANRVMPSARRVSTQMIRIFGELGKPKAVEAFQNLGITVKDMVTGNIIPAGKLFTELFREFQNDAGNVKQAIEDAFGEAAIKPVISILGQMRRGIKNASGEMVYGADVLKVFDDTMKGARGSVERESLKAMNTTQGAVMRMREAWTNFKITLGDTVAPILKVLAMGLKGLMDSVRAFVGLPVVGFLVKVATGFLMLKTALFVGRAVLWGYANILKVTAANVLGLGAATRGLAAAERSHTVVARSARITGAARLGSSMKRTMANMAETNSITANSRALFANSGALQLNRARLEQSNLSKIKGIALAKKHELNLRAEALALKNVAGGAQTASWAMKGLKFAAMGALLFLPEILMFLKQAPIETKKFADNMEALVGQWKRLKDMQEATAKTSIKTMRALAAQQLKAMAGKAGGLFGGGVHRALELKQLAALASKGGADTLKALRELKKIDDERAKGMVRVIESQLAAENKIMGLRAKSADAEVNKRLSSARKAKEMLTLGTNQFNTAVGKLESIYGAKPKLIKQAQIDSMFRDLQEIRKRGIGGMYAGHRVGKLQMNLAERGLAGLRKLMALKEKGITGKAVSGAEVINAMRGVGHAMLAYQSAAPGNAKRARRFYEGVLGPLIHQIKDPMQRRRAMLMLQLGGGYHPETGKPVKGYIPEAGAFGRRVDIDRLMGRITRPELGVEFPGGGAGLPAAPRKPGVEFGGATLDPGFAAAAGIGPMGPTLAELEGKKTARRRMVSYQQASLEIGAETLKEMRELNRNMSRDPRDAGRGNQPIGRTVG